MEFETLSNKTIEEIVREILADLAENEDTIGKKEHKEFPPMLGLGDGKAVYVTRKTVALTNRLRHSVYSIETDPKQFFTHKDFKIVVEHAVAKALLEVKTGGNTEENCQTFLKFFENYVGGVIDEIKKQGGREYCFGCSLVSEPTVSPFDIGPVRFEPRAVWLERKSTDKRTVKIGARSRVIDVTQGKLPSQISLTTKRRILRHWNGETLRPRRPSWDSHTEGWILNAVGEFPYVSTVTLPGLGSDLSYSRAPRAVQTALTGLSLMWAQPSSALRGLSFSYRTERRDSPLLFFTENGLPLGGSHHYVRPFASYIDETPFENMLKKFDATLKSVGNVIEWNLSPQGQYSNPAVRSVLSQALYWFRNACIAEMDLMAITGFATCLDILSLGQYETQRLTLIKNMCEADPNKQFLNDGTTIKEFLKRVFDGRRRMLHGPFSDNGTQKWDDQFTHDWIEVRSQIEHLARSCLVGCLDWAEKNPSQDDPQNFIT